ncbi:transcriptional regulator [Pasteurella multocida]|nr:transcriptional regulator [Pasteurella multocida]
MTDCLKVAHYFGKRHDKLLNTIKKLGCSYELRLIKFKESYVLNEQNKKQPMFYMTQDVFTLLVMVFTGKKAMQFKEQYI